MYCTLRTYDVSNHAVTSTCGNLVVTFWQYFKENEAQLMC